MAGNYIVIGSKFKPFSYEELVRPYEKYGAAYKEQENLYSDLESQTGTIANKINQQLDKDSYAQYKTYESDLNKQAELLAKQGLNTASRKDLLNMRSRYAKEINPIEQSILKREQMSEEQRKLRAQDSSIMYDNDFTTMSLDQIRANPNLGYKSISGTELAKRSSAMSQAIKNIILSDPEFKSVLNGQYFQSKMQQGATMDQVIAGMSDDPNAPKEFKKIKENLWKEYGIDQYSKDIQQRASNAINTGFYDSIGTIKYDMMKDDSYASPLQWAQHRLSQAHYALAAEQQRWARQDREDNYMPLTNDNPIKKAYPNGTKVKFGSYGKITVLNDKGEFEGILDSKQMGELNNYMGVSNTTATPTTLPYGSAIYTNNVRLDGSKAEKIRNGFKEMDLPKRQSFKRTYSQLNEKQKKRVKDEFESNPAFVGLKSFDGREIDQYMDFYVDGDTFLSTDKTFFGGQTNTTSSLSGTTGL